MMYKSHLVFGIFIGIVYLLLFGVSGNKYLFLSFVGLAALFPDIDHENSKIGNKVKVLSFLIRNVFGHRGFFHSIFPAVILYFVFVYIFNLKLIGLGIAVGYISHLMSDALTVTGVNFLHPFKAKVSGFIRTGSILEYIFFFVFLVLDVWKVYGFVF